MAFGADLKSCFQYLAKRGNKRFYEAELTTKLQDSLLFLALINPDTYFSEIIHGDRSKVEFPVCSSWVTGAGPVSVRELADIMFVAYSRKQRMFRICFMQNKAEYRRGKGLFTADLLQLDLLHNRSVFTPVADKKPNRIMNDSKEVSVALYGVFVGDGNTYNMNTYAAAGLSPVNHLAGPEKRRVKFDKTSASRASASVYPDQTDMKGLEAFGDALVNGQIGRVIRWDDVVNVDILRGMCGFRACPAGLKGDLEDCVVELEEKMRREDLHWEKMDERMELDVSEMVMFLDLDRVDSNAISQRCPYEKLPL